MTTTTEIPEIVVHRDTWLRGNTMGPFPTERVQLINEQGHKCCLGFAGLCWDIPAHTLVNTGTPDEVNWEWKGDHPFSLLVDINDLNTQLARDTVMINDNPTISDEEREEELTALFATKGIVMRFTDDPEPESR